MHNLSVISFSQISDAYKKLSADGIIPRFVGYETTACDSAILLLVTVVWVRPFGGFGFIFGGLSGAALVAIGCRQFRVCNTGKCPTGIATQDPVLRTRLDVAGAARGLANFLRVSSDELKDFARLTGKADVHQLGMNDLCTTNSEISNHTAIPHV